jgi:two-component system response regulator MtrA
MNRVLIVEDDLTIARIYRGLVRREGCDPLLAEDGQLAIEALNQVRPDLVLLDLMLPKKSGVEVLRHMRATPRLQDVPVVVFTNACFGTLVQEAIEAGANQCLIKAQTAPKQLIETLRQYLKLAPPPSPVAVGVGG